MHPEAKRYWSKWMHARKALRAMQSKFDHLRLLYWDKRGVLQKRHEELLDQDARMDRRQENLDHREKDLRFREAAIERGATAGLEAKYRLLAAKTEEANTCAKRFESAAQLCSDINDALLLGSQGPLSPAQRSWLDAARKAATDRANRQALLAYGGAGI